MEEMEPVVTQEIDVKVKPELSHWYEGHISLEDAKTFIKSNIATAARSFIAIGFYLKCVRDRELFIEEDYQDVWEFAKTEYGISKSTASRYMSMNDRFSENGNSPNIREEYRAFGKSQLQEMLYLEDDQLEQVRPGDRVEDIRNLRRPKEVPYIELPGQLDFEIDFPAILPPDYSEAPVTSQKQTFEMNVEDLLSDEEQEGIAISQQEPEEKQDPLIEENQEISPQENPGFYNSDDEKEVDESYSMASFPKASDRHVTMLAKLLVQENIGMLFHAGVFYRISDEEIIDMLRYCSRRQNPIIIDNDVEVAVCAEIIEFSRGDEDLGICLFQKFANYVRKQIDEYIKERSAKERQEKAQEQQPENNQGSGTLNSTLTSCPHREGYSCTVLVENKAIPGDGSNCGSSCCWTCKFQGKCKFECNASASRDGEFPEYDAAWFVKEWAKEVPSELERVLGSCYRRSTNTERAKAVQEEISPYGAYSRSCWEYEFSFHSFAKGIDFRIGKVDINMKYGRFVQELMSLYPDFVEPESKEPEIVIEEPGNVQEQPETVPDPPETVIDGEFVEIPPEQSIRSILEEEKAELHNWIKVYQDEGQEMPPMVERQKIIVAALACMVAELERSEPEPEFVKQEQPELPLLKNNDQRAAFIDAYETWPLWIETKETGERYYRYDLSEKVAMVVKVSRKHSWSSYKESNDYEYGAERYYLLGVKVAWSANSKGAFTLDNTRTFYECNTNKSTLVEYLKELQKKGKGE